MTDIMAELIMALLLPFCLLFSTSDARCRQDQVDACRSAVRSDSLSTFDNGGFCEPREYDIYDHLCTLNYYTSGVDYCCCSHERNALCCRFYYDHNYFRCDQEEDYINVPPSLTTILIIAGVVFVIFALIVIAFTVKCIKARRASGHESCCYTGSSDSKPNQDAETSDGASSSSRRVHQSGASSNKPESVTSYGSPEAVPLTSFAGGTTTGTRNVDDTNNNEGHRPQPSAPPVSEEDSENIPVPPPYHRAASEPAIPVIPEPLHGPDHPMFRLDSENPDTRARLISIPEAPPAYDEHHRDPRYHPEMDGNQDTRSFY